MNECIIVHALMDQGQDVCMCSCMCLYVHMYMNVWRGNPVNQTPFVVSKV